MHEANRKEHSVELPTSPALRLCACMMLLVTDARAQCAWREERYAEARAATLLLLLNRLTGNERALDLAHYGGAAAVRVIPEIEDECGGEHHIGAGEPEQRGVESVRLVAPALLALVVGPLQPAPKDYGEDDKDASDD